MSSQTTHVNSQPQPRLKLIYRDQEVELRLDKLEHRLGRDTSWSNFDYSEVRKFTTWDILSSRHAILRKEGDDYRIIDGDENKSSTNGLWLNNKRIGTEPNGYLLRDGMDLRVGQNPRNHIRIIYDYPNHDYEESVDMSKIQPLNLAKAVFPVEIGREPSGNSVMKLPAPTVSGLHAKIRLTKGGSHIRYLIEDNNSTNGTFVNGQKITKAVPLENNDIVQIGPYRLIRQDFILKPYDQGNEIRLDAHNLFCVGRDQQVRLDNISLPIEPGQLVALLGGSGTGKSTLLKTLLGIEPTQEGAVYINGADLRQNFNIYRSQIGYVPQDDIVYPNLTVEESLRYACKLRLPPETEVKATVQTVLKQVDLEFVKHNLIRELSGGQRKRVCIAVELLADPKLFFLDEPTSGLDPGLDQKMMEMLKKLAGNGRTIVLVTHAIANIEMCHCVAFLGRGGRLCYFGKPLGAKRFFNLNSNESFSAIYSQLEQGVSPDNQEVGVETAVVEWVKKFQGSIFYKNAIQAKLGSPSSQGEDNTVASVSTQPKTKKPQAQKQGGWRQLWVLCQRYALLSWRDRASLAWSLLPAPVGIFLTFLATDSSPLVASSPREWNEFGDALTILFVFTFAALLSGLLSSLPEIVKEAGVYHRERLVNLGLLPYLGSKVLVRSALAILQTILISLVILVFFIHPEPELMPWFLGLGITTFLTIFASLCLGLAVSAFSETASAAMNSLTFIVLPQIIFSGVLFKLEGGFGEFLSGLMISRWSVGAYGILVNVNDFIPEPLPGVDPLVEGSDIYEPMLDNLLFNWGMLGLHAIIYLLIVLIVQKRKDII